MLSTCQSRFQRTSLFSPQKPQLEGHLRLFWRGHHLCTGLAPIANVPYQHAPMESGFFGFLPAWVKRNAGSMKGTLLILSRRTWFAIRRVRNARAKQHTALVLCLRELNACLRQHYRATVKDGIFGDSFSLNTARRVVGSNYISFTTRSQQR